MDEPGSKPSLPATLGDGRYIIGRELGRGTMGVVFEAEDTVLARVVAIKTIELAFAASQEAREQFERRFFAEARVAARLSHPGIVVCHDVGKDRASGKLFIVFECLRGRTLAARAGESPLAWREALDVLVRVARAIQHAHEHGVVHRDLKPANIMLLDAPASGASGARGETAVKIMDFGVARLESLGPRLTGPGQSFCSPLYASPEQVLGEASSARSDIFSLGSILCTLLLGRPWFDAPSIPAILARVIHGDPPRVSRLRPDVPAAVDAIVAVALAKREDDRYATAAEMADDLEDVLAGGTPRRARAVAPSAAPALSSAEDPLLDCLVAPGAGPSRVSVPDATASLASLLDQAPTASPGSPTTPPPASSAAPTGRARLWLTLAVAVTSMALLGAAAFVLWPRPSLPEPTHETSGPTPVQGTPAASTLPTPITIAPAVVAGGEASTATPPVPPTSGAAPTPPAATPQAPPATDRPTVGTATPASEPPRAPAPGAGELAAVVSPAPAARTRMRLDVVHPFENGRLIVWIDGVLVFEAKLQAPVSKKIVAIKVREGRLEKLLDVEPGRHEVRVEVTWDQERRTARKVADVAPGATGLLDVRVGRIGKDLNLQWSRLARE